MKIAILLSTYNGSLYLKEQIDSILTQSEKNWKLFIRDDGSTDDTHNIIKEYEKNHPNKIFIIEDLLGNLKSAASFMRLLECVEADYYMFCDQDDVWLSHKIEATLSKIKLLESKNYGKSAMVFTNLAIVDIGLNVINKSMWNYSNINPENAKFFYRTTCLSSVSGCTVMFNNFLKLKVLPFPSNACMHDWWISLNASYYGFVDYIVEPTILYRQHEKNVLGAEVFKKKYFYLIKIFNLVKTFNENVKVFKMLNSLRFKVNFSKVVIQKLQIILTK